jgi:Cu(I)/Ag(I) efflux system membrane fusion protein
MDPNFRKDKPGKSPMGMDLIPVYEGAEPGAGAADEKALRISPAVVNNMGVRTADVVRRTLNLQINTVGFIVPDDELTQDVHVRSEGWIEKLMVKTAGERIKQGELLFQLYSRALTNAQAEYVQALKIGREALARAARTRLEALGMSERQIQQVGKAGKPSQLVDVYAPQDGYVVALNVREGMFIQPDTTVFVLADLSTIWVMVEVYEDQANQVQPGQKAEMRLRFVPGKIWEGTVDYVYPTIDAKSRTVRVRLQFNNPSEELKPNMYAEITIHGKARENVLSIPRDALIRSGKSERVILALGDGRFRPAQVVSGMESGDRMEIVVGLREGERVVSSGQFLIDSEASLDASLLRMVDPSEAPDASSEQESDIEAVGVVEEMKTDDRKLNITHDPIPAIGWPTMTMDFRIGEEVELKGLKTGDRIHFTLKRDRELGDFVISSISKSGAEAGSGGLQ